MIVEKCLCFCVCCAIIKFPAERGNSIFYLRYPAGRNQRNQTGLARYESYNYQEEAK